MSLISVKELMTVAAMTRAQIRELVKRKGIPIQVVRTEKNPALRMVDFELFMRHLKEEQDETNLRVVLNLSPRESKRLKNFCSSREIHPIEAVRKSLLKTLFDAGF